MVPYICLSKRNKSQISKSRKSWPIWRQLVYNKIKAVRAKGFVIDVQFHSVIDANLNLLNFFPLKQNMLDLEKKGKFGKILIV